MEAEKTDVNLFQELKMKKPCHGDFINDNFQSPAYKRGVQDAKLELEPREMSQEYLKGYASIDGFITLQEITDEISKN